MIMWEQAYVKQEVYWDSSFITLLQIYVWQPYLFIGQ